MTEGIFEKFILEFILKTTNVSNYLLSLFDIHSNITFDLKEDNMFEIKLIFIVLLLIKFISNCGKAELGENNKKFFMKKTKVEFIVINSDKPLKEKFKIKVKLVMADYFTPHPIRIHKGVLCQLPEDLEKEEWRLHSTKII